MKSQRKFKNPVFECSVQTSDGTTQRFYQTAQTRIEAYEIICKTYPVRAGYCRRFVLGEV